MFLGPTAFPTPAPSFASPVPSHLELSQSPTPLQSSTSNSSDTHLITTAIVVLWVTTLLIICTFGIASYRLFQSIMEARARRRGGRYQATTATTAEPVQREFILLPSILFQDSTAASSNRDVTCSICLCEIFADDICKELPLCQHVFHSSCIEEWFSSSTVCPLCKQDFFTENSRLRARVRCDNNDVRQHGGEKSFEMRDLMNLHTG